MKLILVCIFVLSAFSQDVPPPPEAQRLVIDYSTASMCPFDCKPDLCEPTVCPTGVESQWDGCRCCRVCPRGQGDMCDFQHPCSETLNCVFVDGTGSRGICRSNKTCRLASGRVLQDGETFQPHCSMQCSCQGGLVGCASLCQDERSMAFIMKGNCQRVRIPNTCCPQWICDHTSLLPDLFFRKGNMEPDNSAAITVPVTTETPEESGFLRPQREKGDSNEKVEVEYVAPVITLHQQQEPAKASQMRSIGSSASLKAESKSNSAVTNCTGTPITLRSCSLNKCGLRITDDFISRDLTCPASLMPTFAYCMFRPCTKKRRQDPCTRNSVPLAEFEVKVRHSGCHSKTIPVKYCKSCKSTINRCCLPTMHTLVAYQQPCFDGSTRTFYVAQTTACSCRSDVFRQRDCQILYQKMMKGVLPSPTYRVYQKDDDAKSDD